MKQLSLPIARIRVARAPLVVLKVNRSGGTFSYDAESGGGKRQVMVEHDHAPSGRVIAFVARVNVREGVRLVSRIIARARLLRDVRMQLAMLYPELPRERRRGRRKK